MERFLRVSSFVPFTRSRPRILQKIYDDDRSQNYLRNLLESVLANTWNTFAEFEEISTREKWFHRNTDETIIELV